MARESYRVWNGCYACLPGAWVNLSKYECYVLHSAGLSIFKKNPNCYYTLLLHLYSGRSGIVSRVFNVCYRARKPLFVPCGLWCIGYGRTFTFAPICEAAIAACVLLHPLCLYILNSNRFSMKFFCSDLFDSKHTLLARLQSRSSRACQKMICIEK